MKKDSKKPVTKKVSGKKENPSQFETDSQAQNRHGKGRQQNGADSAAGTATGSNH